MDSEVILAIWKVYSVTHNMDLRDASASKKWVPADQYYIVHHHYKSSCQGWHYSAHIFGFGPQEARALNAFEYTEQMHWWSDLIDPPFPPSTSMVPQSIGPSHSQETTRIWPDRANDLNELVSSVNCSPKANKEWLWSLEACDSRDIWFFQCLKSLSMYYIGWCVVCKCTFWAHMGGLDLTALRWSLWCVISLPSFAAGFALMDLR